MAWQATRGKENQIACREMPYLYSRLCSLGVIIMANNWPQKTGNGYGFDFGAHLWAAADKMRGHMDVSQYAAKSKDVPVRVYKYFLGKFASAEGKGGGEFYTPQRVVQVLVHMLEPYKGRVFDPCCGSGGMFVQSEKFVEEHGGRVGDIAVYGQESNYTSWKLARMNLAIRGIDANLGPGNADTFRADLHPDLKADLVPVRKDLANPPFNMSDWGRENLPQDVRWNFG